MQIEFLNRLFSFLIVRKAEKNLLSFLPISSPASIYSETFFDFKSRIPSFYLEDENQPCLFIIQSIASPRGLHKPIMYAKKTFNIW